MKDFSETNDFAVLKVEIQHLREDINKLLRIIMDSNGNSMLSRMAVIETKVIDLDKYRSQINQQAWAIRLAILAASASFLGTLILMALQYLTRAHS